MVQIQKVIVTSAVGLAAASGLANPSDILPFEGPLAHSGEFSHSVLRYIITSMDDPSNVAPIATRSPAQAEQSVDSMPSFTLAGPSNTPAGGGAAFNIDLGGSGDGPGTGDNEFLPVGPAPDLLVSLQTADKPNILTHRVDPVIEIGPGGFQVVVPLPGAGFLAAGGLAFVAIRRRR